MKATAKINPHTEIRALYSALIESEERFREFKRHLALYDLNPDLVDEEPPRAAAVRQRLNERIQTWVAGPFAGISVVEMLQWRAIIVEERFNVVRSP